MKIPEKPPSSFLNFSTEGEKLTQLLRDVDSIQSIRRLERQYHYWDNFKYRTKDIPFDPPFLWKYVKLTRSSGFVNIVISNQDGFKFKFNIYPTLSKYLHEFDLNFGGSLQSDSFIPEEDKDKYLISSIMEEAIASSQLEGAAVTREIAKEMLRTQRKPKSKDEKMIVNNYNTIKKIVKNKNTKLSKEFIKEIHSCISKDTLFDANYEGKFRTSDEIRVFGPQGEILYTPPKAELLDQLLDSFCNFANSNQEETFIHPIVRGIILHFLMGYIHPFIDGNGRTARAIFYWYLISRGYWLIEYLSISRIIIKSPISYAKAYLYSEFDENDLTYFLDYNLRSMDLALKSLKDYIKKKIKEKNKLYYIIKGENVNDRQLEIIKFYMTNPQKSYSIKEVESKFGVAYQTARTDLLGLVDLGYLIEKKSTKKILFFKSPEFDRKIDNLKAIDSVK
jgi:Fic family protein